MSKAMVVVLVALVLAGCEPSSNGNAQRADPETAPPAIAMGQLISARDIPAGYYEANEANRRVDPNDALIQAFRDRKARDLTDPAAPRPFSAEELAVPKRLRSSRAEWNDLADVFRFDWTALTRAWPDEVEQLSRTIGARVVFDHPDLKIVELAIGSGGLLPAHAQLAPAAYHVVGGSAEVTVDARTVVAHTGTSIKLEPLAERRIRVTSVEPLKVLWFSWAPGGRQDYLSYGYYLTGANFHAQPREAVMPEDYQHWADAARKPYEDVAARSEVEPASRDDFSARQRAELEELRSADSEPRVRYPAAPLFSNELDVAWLDFTNLGTAAFFWAEDASRGAGVMEIWNGIVRMKGIFQAKVPDGQYDLNYSYIALGPHGSYVTHSHATPEFYYVLGGQTEWIVAGETYTARAGDVFMHGPYQDHEMLVLETGVPMRAVTGSWAPFGDRAALAADFLLLEPLPEQPPKATIPGDFDFHAFDLKTDLEFAGS